MIVANVFGNSVTAQALLTVVSPPMVTTSNPGGTDGNASLSGTVNPNRAATTAWFEWGLSTDYGNPTPAAQLGSGAVSAGLFYHLTGLVPGIAYHYRLVATNIAGRSDGRDVIYQAPRVGLVGANPMTNECHSPFADPGAQASGSPLAVAGGLFCSLALKADGTVLGWGYDGFGQVEIPGDLSNVVAIASQAASDSCLALKADGTVVGWGDNRSGQTSIPAGLSNVTAIVAAHFHSLALKSDGTVTAWGTDWTGGDAQSDVPPDLSNVTAITAGNYYSLALESDGTLVGWGYDINGVLDIPTGLTNVTKIAGGWDFALALKTDGTVVSWGGNLFGQTDTPPGLSNVIAVATGYGFSLALKSDGTVVKWGWDDYWPDMTVPVGLTNVVAIAAGDYHALALKSDGTIAGWGDNGYGEIDIPASVTNLPMNSSVVGVVDTNNPGMYTLTYYAVNAIGIIGTATRTVIVVDTTPPTLTCPTNLTVEFDTEAGATVSFTPEAFDLCASFTTVTCDPASGSMFPIGTTPVLCAANDVAGNSSSCTFQVTVLGAQGVMSNVLADSIDLRGMVGRPNERGTLDEVIHHLRKSLQASLWIDQTHITRLNGVNVFNQEEAAIQSITRRMENTQGMIPDEVLQALINRAVKAARLLAVTAIQDATNISADSSKLAGLLQLVVKGDGDAFKANYGKAIEHYKDAWHGALHLSTLLSGGMVNGKLRLEFSGFPGETYVIETSTNLTGWVTVGAGTVGAYGSAHFETVPSGNYKARFYRIKFSH